MSVRTFMALDLDDAILDRLAEVARSVVEPASKINWVDRRSLHVTLCFLGDVPDDRLAEACDMMAAAAGEVEPFDFTVRGVTVVPPKAAPRMYWAGVDEPTGRLLRLQQSLTDALAGLGVRQEERGYKPHITLARIKVAGNFSRLRASADEFTDREFGIQAADEVVAYASQLTKEGPIYTPIARARLGE